MAASPDLDPQQPQGLQPDPLSELFEHKLYLAILHLLSLQGPQQYTDIVDYLMSPQEYWRKKGPEQRTSFEQSPGYVRSRRPGSAGAITKSLTALVKLGVVEKGAGKRDPWSITQTGLDLLAQARYAEVLISRRKKQRANATTAAEGRVSAQEKRETLRQVNLMDITVAHPARRYDYWLGGKDNFAADRAAGDAIELVFPEVRVAVRANRDAVYRVVRHLAGECGIRQFLDIGSGLPTHDSVHEIAQAVAPDCRVLYVDNDPLVSAHARALLVGEGATAYLEADVRDPESILDSAELHEILDLSQPVGLLLFGVLHFIEGAGAAQPIVDTLLDALAPGSYVAITHTTMDFATPEQIAAHEEMVAKKKSDFWTRPQDEIRDMLSGLELLEPGLVPPSRWRPGPDDPDPAFSVIGIWAGVGIKLTESAEQRALELLLTTPGCEYLLRAMADGPVRHRLLRENYVDALQRTPPRVTSSGQTVTVPDDGQLSKLLNKAEKAGLANKVDLGDQTPPSRWPWALTPHGESALLSLETLLRVSRGDISAEPVAVTTTAPGSPAQEKTPAQGDVPDSHVRAEASVRKTIRESLEKLNASKPHPARRYDYWLGGKDNFAADRASAKEYERLIPDVATGARQNRAVLLRMVDYMAKAGIRQFVDIGSGIPTAPNPHEVAQSVAPQSRVLYVDNDRLVEAHARARLLSKEQGRVGFLCADLREPDTILGSAVLRETLDLSEPIGLLLSAVLHFIPGVGAAQSIVDQLKAALAPGSYVAITHGTEDFMTSELRREHRRMQKDGGSDVWLRSRREIATLLDGMDLVEPGIVAVTHWRPAPDTPDLPLNAVGLYAAVGRKK